VKAIEMPTTKNNKDESCDDRRPCKIYIRLIKILKKRTITESGHVLYMTEQTEHYYFSICLTHASQSKLRFLGSFILYDWSVGAQAKLIINLFLEVELKFTPKTSKRQKHTLLTASPNATKANSPPGASIKPTRIAAMGEIPNNLPTMRTKIVFPAIKRPRVPNITGKFEKRSFGLIDMPTWKIKKKAIIRHTVRHSTY
jgi:hypothetical protein